MFSLWLLLNFVFSVIFFSFVFSFTFIACFWGVFWLVFFFWLCLSKFVVPVFYLKKFCNYYQHLFSSLLRLLGFLCSLSLLWSFYSDLLLIRFVLCVNWKCCSNVLHQLASKKKVHIFVPFLFYSKQASTKTIFLILYFSIILEFDINPEPCLRTRH